MAASIIRFHLKLSLPRRLYDVARHHPITKSRCSTIMWDHCYLFHTSPFYYKKRKTIEEKKAPRLIQFPPKAKLKDKEPIEIWQKMTVQELSNGLKKDLDSVFKIINYIDETSPYDQPSSVIYEMKMIEDIVKISGNRFQIIAHPHEASDAEDDSSQDLVKRPPPDPSVLIKRHPVVTIMGHVDHGKTTLLDALRSSAIVDSEFGGITQHIGAFNVTLQTGERITFLDTPGHAAFSAMRARGANVTDIVVLVVAADDGVMEQTIQSIAMAKAADVPIIVAINKIDKPDANIDRTKKMLSRNGIQVEDMGGEVQSVNISALKKTNIHELTDAVAAQAELMSLKGDPTGQVEAAVIESSNDPGRGKLATILIQRGTLKKGTVLVCGKAWGKVRSMFDESGTPVSEAKLSEAVQVIGWRDLPVAGDEILEAESEKRAHEVIKYRMAKELQIKARIQAEVADEKHQEHLVEYKAMLERKRKMGVKYKLRRVGPREKEVTDDDGSPKVNIVVKGDVGGSVEAILDVLDTYNQDDKCRLNVIHYGVGNITETDIELAGVFNAIVYSFNVETPSKVASLAKENNVPVRSFNIIYKMIDNLKVEISNKLPSIQEEEILGEANVLQQFEITEGKRKVLVAGCRCVKGTLQKNALFKLMRENQVIHTGSLASMRHVKNEVESIKNGVDCGLRLADDTVACQSGDILVCFKYNDKPQQCGWDPGF